jgi:hypothetical protein
MQSMRRIIAVVSAIAVAAGIAAAQRDHGPPPSELAAKCGSRIAWQPSLEAALARAKELNRPVFWYLATVPRSPMDRKPVIDMYMRAGPFSMPDVIAAINGRFVPVSEYPKRDVAKARNLLPLEFIEPGFLVLKPDGEEIGRVDRITTFHELWLVDVLDRILQPHGELARPPEGSAAPETPYERGRVAARRGDAAGARKLLEGVTTPEAQVELGLLALREEDWARAAEILAAVTGGERAHEARYLHGAALHRMNRQPEAAAIWKQIATDAPDSPWAAKAAAEAERWGPFSRGFEEYGYLPKDAAPDQPARVFGTQRARKDADADWIARRSVRYLLERQNPDGGFDDSHYDFGGRDSLPDVYVAVTALCALALLEWRSIDAGRVDEAVRRAAKYLADEDNVATGNKRERVWAHGYRALFFSRLAESSEPLAAGAREKLAEIVRLLGDLQLADGGFAHEYPNPFATATALHALKVAERTGARVSREVFERGAATLGGSRGDDGTFSYAFGRTRGSRDLDMAAGRMPTCELALLLCGHSTQKKLVDAVRTSHERHAALEQVRKYDDHAPPHGIGGFFFWYDVFGRCLAIDAIEDAATRRAFFRREREIVLGITEIDGRFVDSHELGKPYGTAMGLLSLRLTAPDAP